MKRIAQIFSGNASLFVIGAAVLAFFVPDVFAWTQKGDASNIILGLIMLTMGCTLSGNDFKILLQRPLDIFIGAAAQYTIMPLIAFALTKVFGLNPYMAVGIILVGCCPGGVSSNIMSFLCKGDVAFSVGMTTVSTLLSPLLTPLLVLLLAGTSVDVNAWGMFRNILFVTLLPVCGGCLLNWALSGRKSFGTVKEILPAISVICLCLIVGGVVCKVRGPLMEQGIQLFFLTLGVVFCHNTLGYALGYMVGKLFRFNKAKKRTICIEIGMQNAGMATVLANNFFATPAAIAANPLAALSIIPCAISCAYHSISGTVLANIFLLFDRKKDSTKS